MNRLAHYRIAAGLSARSAAALLGVPELRLLRFERSAALPTRAQLLKLSRLYNVSYSELSGLSAPPARQNAEWYIRRHGDRTIIYRADLVPQLGLTALVRRGGLLVEEPITPQLLCGGERLVAVSSAAVDEL